MKPLIDADVLRYEIGFIGEDEEGPRSFEYLIPILDGRIEDICEAVGATEPPCLYFTGPGNFREQVAKTKQYKGNRLDVKPFHFQNITVYLQNAHEYKIAEGIEADDLMSIDQVQAIKDGKETVICTRDKDLRMVPGWHYGWECGNQREFGPHKAVDSLSYDPEKGKLTGMGDLFFWSQMLTGDPTDNIPGLPKVGPSKAWNILKDCEPGEEWEVVRDEYYARGFDDEYILEQGQLLWMIRERDESGEPVRWQLPD